MSRVAAVVLAAGGSLRMGSPKQLLQLDGESLVRRAVRTASASRCEGVYAVVGARAEQVARELDGIPCEIVENPQWAEGIASSIRCGVAAVEAAQPSADGLLLCLADQPGVTTAVLNRLIERFEHDEREIAACSYAETVGVPALFARRHFVALRELTGDRGAKALLQAAGAQVARVAFEPAAVDVDTPSDHGALLASREPGD